MRLYRGIVKGRQRQLKTQGTGIWFTSSLDVAKTYSDDIEIWDLDESLDLQGVQINCKQKSWNEINTDVLARKYKDFDVIIFKDIVDVGPLVLKYAKKDDRPIKENLKDFTADTIVVNNENCIKRVQLMKVESVSKNKKVHKVNRHGMVWAFNEGNEDLNVEDLVELNQDWENFAEEFSYVFGEENLDRLLSEVKLRIDYIVNDKGENIGYGVTKLCPSGLLVTIDPEYFYMGDNPRKDVLLHEMAHCCVYFDNHTLIPNGDGHGKEWQEYVEVLNSIPGIDIRPMLDDEYDMILAESKKNKKKSLKEGIWIATPETPVKLWIVDENRPDMSCGYIESTCKEDVLMLQIYIQKEGYKVVYSKPKNCIYARGIPLRVLLGEKTYAEFTTDKYNTAILEAFKQTAKALKIDLKQTKQDGLSVKENESPFSNNNYWKKNKNKVFKFKQGLKEAVGNKNDYNYSHAEHLDFEVVKDMFKHPKKLAKYMFEHPELLDVVQPGAFGYADDVGRSKGFEEYYKYWLEDAQTGFDIISTLTDLENPKEVLTLYRGVIIFDVEPDLKEPGICWSYEKEGAEDWLESLNDDDPESAPCIMEGKTTLENIDWIITFLLLCVCPEEREIRIWDDSKIKITDWEVL